MLFDGRRAAGVTVRIGDEQKEFRARDIIVSLGGIHSPAFLMRAGIGAAKELRQHGIEVRADLPGVGKNLSNHAIVFIGLLQKPGARQARRIRPHPMTCFRYSSNLPGAPPFDMYINVQCKTSWSPLGSQVANLAPSLLKPMARGRVSLVSADPTAHPLVEFNFTGHDLDLHRFMQGFRRCVEILAHEAVRAMTRLTFPVKFSDRLRQLNRITPANRIKSTAIAALIDLAPPLAGPIFSTLADRRVDLAALVKDDDALAEHIRQNVAGTFHPVGTCRMGAADDPAAVTDPAGRVRGIEGLRVIDASIMPTLPRGNTNIPTIMVAEKLAAEMLQRKACIVMPLRAAQRFTSLRHADVNLAVAHRDFHRRQAQRRVAGMAAGREIVLVAVPRADDVARLAEAQAGALLVGGDDFLDLVEDLALANRAAGMRAHVLVGEHLAAVAEDADFELIHRENPIIAVGDIAQLAYCDFLHLTLQRFHSIPGGR